MMNSDTHRLKIDKDNNNLLTFKIMTNIAIFVSGNGTNCENIIRYFKNNQDICIKLVISSKADAYALTRASWYDVPCKVLSKQEINDSGTVIPLLEEWDINFIVLAGFMLMVPDFIIDKFEHQIVNIHPSLLPKFGGKGMYGHHVHEAVKAAGEKESGITIHFVSKVCDGGEIIAQFKTPVSPEDTAEDIEKKIHVLEQKHFPEVIKSVIMDNTRK